MSGFEVVAGQIRAAATQLRSAADGVRDADPSGEVGDVGSALPGGQSAGAAASLAEAWRTRFGDWYDDAVAQSDNMRASADTYDASDHAADVRLRTMMRRLGESVV